MRNEIAVYDAQRERAFGREHGYQVYDYPRTDAPTRKRKRAFGEPDRVEAFWDPLWGYETPR